MLDIKTIDRALAKYAATDDPVRAESLTVFGALLKESAAIAAELNAVVPQWSREDLLAAAQGEKTLLSTGALAIRAKDFEAVLKRLAGVYSAAAELDEEAQKLCDEVDWSDYATESLMETASNDPTAYLQAVEALSPDEDLLDLYVLPILGFALRAFLDAAATQASRKMDELTSDTVHFKRSLTCPVCGSGASIAAVVETPRNGNIKKLYCSCCGASWKFERIRCAVCGDEAVSDLSYVHDEKDESHRLHVCKSCGAAMPTVFAGEELNFNADVEGIVMSGLENFYEEEKAGKTQSA